MRKYALLAITFLFVSVMVVGQSNDENEVAITVESLRKAMLSADVATLDRLTAEKLSYGHSSGLVEDKKEFIRKISSKENIYTEIIFSDQTISISGDAAIVRHKFDVSVNISGKATQLKLIVMMAWQKQGGQWKLLGRQSVRKPEP
jgi:ketosteroid isomerase-like protein